MSAILSALAWIIAHWSELASGFSAVSTLILFFMHGNNKQALQELRDFVNSVHVSEDKPSAKENAEAQHPKI